MVTTAMVIDLVMDSDMDVGHGRLEEERKRGTDGCLAREYFRHLPDTRCTGRLSSPSVKSRSRLTQEISPASGLQPR